MTVGPAVAVFVVGAVVSLATSWVLVTRLERVGERLGFSEASLGMVAALAADTPEITASITAIAHHQQTVGAGVVLGSNVFNLAALLGLGAVAAGRINLHRKVVVLGGTVAVIVGVACLLSVGGQVSAGVGTQRRPRCLVRLCGAPCRAPEHLGPPTPTRDMVELAQRGHRRGGERARRGHPTARGEPAVTR